MTAESQEQKQVRLPKETAKQTEDLRQELMKSGLDLSFTKVVVMAITAGIPTIKKQFTK